jgi:hypothetical protein
MKGVLSLIIASTLCISACATQVSAEFVIRSGRHRDGIHYRVYWNGSENETDLVKLYRYIRRSDSVSWFEHGHTYARKIRSGDHYNTVHVPAVVTLNVQLSMIPGHPGGLRLKTGDLEFVPDIYRFGSVYSVAMNCTNALGLSQRVWQEYDPGYMDWLRRSRG